jgi:O-methyltransferase involved in polyketide biosynthesis
VAEGLLPYLPPDARLGLLSRILGLAAPGSTLVFDRIAGAPTAGNRLRGLSERSGIDMTSLLAAGKGHDLGAFLRARTWEVNQELTATLADRYGRDLSDPFAAAPAPEPPWLATVFLTARLPT